MYALNLPQFDTKISKTQQGVVILDTLRKKYVALTPEEWVRQHFVHYLMNEKGFPATLMANETQIKLNSLSRRCDTVVYSSDLRPLVICEYKSPKVTINQAVFDQIVRYNIVLRVQYLMVTNGINHYCCKIDLEQQTYTFLPEIPDYTELG